MIERSPQQANLPPTRFARLTAAGRSAVASVAVFGPAATEQVSLYFRPASGKRLEEIACGQIVFGRWTSSHGTGEELIVCRQRDDRVDVHCHGGEAAVETIQDALSSSGCVADQGEPSRLLEVQSPLSIESWQAMIEARTRRGALLMLTQFHGALQQRLFETLTAMQSGQLELAWEGLQRMDQLGAVGLHITHPWKVALVGPPNGGKSSLVNALLGFRRSIVDEQPGTTRDLVSTHTAWDGWPVQLIDTAGLRNTAEGAEHDGIDKVWQHRQQVDLFILVFDCQQRWSPDCQQLGDVFAESLIVYNKSDLISDLAPTDTMLRDLSEESDDRPAGLLASAVTGHGLERLIEEILVQLVPVVPGLGEAVPFTEQQCQLVGDLLQLLKEEQVEEAAERLHRFLEVNCRDEAVQQPSRRLHVDD